MIPERRCRMRKNWEPLVGKIRYWERKTIRAEEETKARKALALIPLFSPVFSVLFLEIKSQHSDKKNCLDLQIWKGAHGHRLLQYLKKLWLHRSPLQSQPSPAPAIHSQTHTVLPLLKKWSQSMWLQLPFPHQKLQLSQARHPSSHPPPPISLYSYHHLCSFPRIHLLSPDFLFSSLHPNSLQYLSLLLTGSGACVSGHRHDPKRPDRVEK